MGIKKFQENTVKAVINSFKNHNRVLVADEVGLGKTIIAREVINMLCNENQIRKAEKNSNENKVEKLAHFFRNKSRGSVVPQPYIMDITRSFTAK